MSLLLLPLIFLSPVLIATAYFDLRFMRIPNLLSIVAIILFVLMLPVIGLSEGGMRLLAAMLVFTIGFVAFAFRLVGGGDVKMLSVLMLFIPSMTWSIYAMVLAVSLVAGLIGVVSWRALPRLHLPGWVSFSVPGAFPMGVSIALSGLSHPIVVFAIM